MMLKPLTPTLAETTLSPLYAEGAGPSLGFLAGLLAQPHCRAWSMVDHDEVIGAIWYQCIERHGELLDLRIISARRRSGRGAALLGETLRLIGDCGVRTVDLEVRESNTPALSLYTAVGFTRTGRRRHYYPLPNGEREDAILMSLMLEEIENPA